MITWISSARRDPQRWSNLKLGHDVKKVMAREQDGIEGVIIGKALYAGKVDLKEALAVAKGVII